MTLFARRSRPQNHTPPPSTTHTLVQCGGRRVHDSTCFCLFEGSFWDCVGPCGEGDTGVVDDPSAQAVEAGAEPGFLLPSVSFPAELPAAHDPRCGAAGPCDGERHDGEQGVQLSGIGDMGILDVEAAALGIGKEAFDGPALAIEPERTPGCAGIWWRR